MTIDTPIPMPAGESIRFDGQVVVVTGVGRGLGAAYARLLAGRGPAVAFHDAGVAQTWRRDSAWMPSLEEKHGERLQRKMF